MCDVLMGVQEVVTRIRRRRWARSWPASGRLAGNRADVWSRPMMAAAPAGGGGQRKGSPSLEAFGGEPGWRPGRGHGWRRRPLAVAGSGKVRHLSRLLAANRADVWSRPMMAAAPAG